MMQATPPRTAERGALSSPLPGVMRAGPAQAPAARSPESTAAADAVPSPARASAGLSQWSPVTRRQDDARSQEDYRQHLQHVSLQEQLHVEAQRIFDVQKGKQTITTVLTIAGRAQKQWSK